MAINELQPERDLRVIKRLVETGDTYKAIAAEFHISGTRVRQIMMKYLRDHFKEYYMDTSDWSRRVPRRWILCKMVEKYGYAD